MSDSKTVLEVARWGGGKSVGGRENKREFLSRLPVGDIRAVAMTDCDETNAFSCTLNGRYQVVDS